LRRRPWPKRSSLALVAAHRAARRLTRACGQAFLTRASSSYFAAEDYEATWTGRATSADLTDMGRKQLGLQPW
jgi:hypothetical protein